jgi:hypothetical protein
MNADEHRTSPEREPDGRRTEKARGKLFSKTTILQACCTESTASFTSGAVADTPEPVTLHHSPDEDPRQNHPPVRAEPSVHTKSGLTNGAQSFVASAGLSFVACAGTSDAGLSIAHVCATFATLERMKLRTPHGAFHFNAADPSQDPRPLPERLVRRIIGPLTRGLTRRTNPPMARQAHGRFTSRTKPRTARGTRW